MKIFLEDDGDAFRDVQIENLVDAGVVQAMVVVHAEGTKVPLVCVRLDLPNGKTVISTVELAVLLTAGEMFVAKHGDPRTTETAARARSVH